MTKSLFSRRSNALSPRRGFTLLEILTSVTLALTLMYAVARIFSNVGGSMNETMSSMEMSNALRNAKNRLTADLEALSTTPAPPRNSRRDEGFFCYVEGMGGPFDRVAPDLASGGNAGNPFAVGDVAIDLERFQTTNDVDANGVAEAIDTTVGDLDDILSFTAKAPDGQPFRGRFIEPVYATATDAAGNVYKEIVDGVSTTIESEYAEIVWFVRGTTLYRRVLPLVSNERLQESFEALRQASFISDSSLAGVAYDNVRRGFGFYQFYDVSVHMGADGTLVANTLGDLSNRENRYFYWNSCGERLHPDDSTLTRSPLSLHGQNGAWYWLRMATLQESAAPNFRAGAPFGRHNDARDSQVKIADGSFNGAARSGIDSTGGAGSGFRNDGTTNDAYWSGFQQALTLTTDGSTALGAGTYNAAQLPKLNSPFINYWDAPHVWDEVDRETGDLLLNAEDLRANGSVQDLTLNQDVMLTNVISFNVRVWDESENAYVDLGSGVASGEAVANDPNDLRSFGRWSDYATELFLPCVYDTWSEQYQRDLYVYDDYKAATVPGYVRIADGAIADIPLDATPTSAQLQNYPPPYDVPLKSVQVEIRVFDPRSKAIRQATFVVDLSKI
ncbi:MAG: hypothetical protein IKU86_12130 [Thermoguttaceae bacterium]|nr:hypothetical protein [Thermoguttaceae bacterium]